MSGKVFLLKCAFQTYAWGKCGSNSEVARLLMNADDKFTVDETTTYAELWMGTHPRGPCTIMLTGESLSDWIKQHPECLGSCAKTWNELPFLFKVLSVNIALSIQVHPNKEMAGKLHSEFPTVYVDDNHKPELAIALTPFEALCGFRPKHEIVAFLNEIDELRCVVGDELASKLSESADDETELDTMQKCFTALMSCDKELISRQLNVLIKRLENSIDEGIASDEHLSKILLRLHSQFPGDVGCFCVYFLNVVELLPGQAVFLSANVPHAYLGGDCLECMACSDNVVRAGLTPKFKDVATLCYILDYRGRPAADNLFCDKPHPTDNFVTLFDPPVPEFSVAKISLPIGTKQYTLEAIDGASIAIMLHGDVVVTNSSTDDHELQLTRGSVLFISAGELVQLTVKSDGSEIEMCRAFSTAA